MTALAGLVLASGACSQQEPETTPTTTPALASTPVPAAVGAAQPSRIFGPDNAFRTDVTHAPVAAGSSAQITHLMDQITPNYGGQVAFNAHAYNPSMVVAAASTPKVRVGFDNCQKKPSVPSGLYDGPKYFVDVPIPATASPATGTDAAMTVWSPSTDQLWEFWIAKKNPRTKQWTACWGGRIDHVSRDGRGVFTHPYGSSASGLATVGSVVSIAEARALKIEHAVQLGLIYTKAGEFAYPANRTDGKDADPAAIALGTRLRLPASIDVDALDLPPLGRAIARAAQRYGFIVTETSGAVAVGAESPKAVLAAGGKDPWDQILGGTADWDVLKGFPWAKLQVVEHGYGAPAGTSKVASS